ncbi:hypothetical protein HanOQP8_Chr01g0025431 [Helianthus annuus]|nr:hypothetical protein HanOQP8_Chr01g0025431 [Helianthus annuus]
MPPLFYSNKNEPLKQTPTSFQHTSSSSSVIHHRVLSMRRGAHLEEEDELDEHSRDNSKTRKHLSIATRITNYFTRTGYLCPITIAAIIILIITSYFLQSHDLLCFSSVSSS